MCSCSESDHEREVASGGRMSRRELIAASAAVAIGGLAHTSAVASGRRRSAGSGDRPLRVQPVLTYDTPRRQEAWSWRPWGGVQTEEAAQQERERIDRDLDAAASKAGFPLEVLPTILVKTPEQADTVRRQDFDALVIFAAGGWANLFQIMSWPDRWNLMFLRHSPGPVYLWYEIAHPHFLRKAVDEFGEPGWSTEDVVVDSYERLLRKLRGLYGLKRTLGKRILALGGAGGWGAGGAVAPRIAREVWKLEIVDFSYEDLGRRLEAVRGRSELLDRAKKRAAAYLRTPGTKLETRRDFLDNAFVLDEVLREVLAEAGTDAITINACMGTIMPISKTTACMPLSMLNDDGYLAFCESDFVVIPSGILLHYISGKPVFLNDPTYPHDGVITLAHCTAPRRLDGKRLEPCRILTHFESDYGAAPKVEMRRGQITTNLIPDFASKDWIGFTGTVVANPFLDICRSQVDIRIHADCDLLARRMKGFHWMTCYGDYLEEVSYALSKLGIGFTRLASKT